MNFRISNLICFSIFALLPLGVSTNKSDSTNVSLKVVYGWGQYASITRGCNNEILSKKKVPFKESGLCFNYYKAPIRLGLIGNLAVHAANASDFYNPNKKDIYSVNPFINLEFKYIAFGAGYSFSSIPDGPYYNSPSGYIRFGDVKNIYVDASIQQSPLYLTDGMLKIGFGSKPSDNFNYWIGYGTNDEESGSGMLIAVDFKIITRFYINTLIRSGSNEGISENAFGLGLTYEFK